MSGRAGQLAVLLTSALALAGQPNLLVYRDLQGQPHTVRTPRDWEQRRRQILAAMQQVMGPLPEDRHVPLEMQVIEEVRLPKYVRRKITYVPEAGDRVPAWLLIPNQAADGTRRKLPAMLCLHQTTRIGKDEPAGLGGKPNLHYAAELAERGYVTLAPDYPNFGDYTFDPYAHGYASATMKGIFNHMRAIDLLASLPEVDARRIGAIGHSLGGHNTLFLGVFDRRVRVMVTSCGFNSFAKYMGGDLTGWSHRGYMPRIASEYGKSASRMPFDFTEVLAALAPRPVFINAPLGDTNFEVSGVRDCIAAAQPVYASLFHAADRLAVDYPEGGHDFPPAVRQDAYRFLDRWLKTP
ncbi:MAG TPA: alpha/beta fold hydrolase [Bryobacteraceae bacterium]|nr:alpha/beta fold hydrolase [Bryobacteraceae bacterium]